MLLNYVMKHTLWSIEETNICRKCLGNKKAESRA